MSEPEIPAWYNHSASGKRITDMKCARDFLFLAGFLISACSQPPDLQTAKLQRFYAEKGEKMTPMIDNVEQRNPQQGTTPSLSTTNAPQQGTTPSLSTTNAPIRN